MNSISVYILALILIFSYTKGFSQPDYKVTTNALLCISAQLSRHQQSIGLKAVVSSHNGHMQLSEQVGFFYYFKSFGGMKKKTELQTSICLLYAYGNENNIDIWYCDHQLNNTEYANSIFYSYNMYFNNYGTSQQTGTLGFSIDKVKVYMENDLFGTPHSDRYRTAGFATEYFQDMHKFAMNIKLWTGDGFGKGAERFNDTDYPARFGYKTLEKSAFGKFSAGILSFGYSYTGDLNQNYSAEIGADAEQIRHIFQNRMMHDLPFLPKWAISYPMPHYPQLQKDGTPYLFKEGQKIRPAKFYYSIAANKSGFY